ncbi:hypothetical protein A1D31_36545 [Bradyrhizobium liaoningense]|nr:hypothetical protein A1D31_36545 [Bradyrhizobium liaoningense]
MTLTIILGAGITSSEIVASQSGNDLVFTISADPITSRNYFTGRRYQITGLKFADGTTLTTQQINAMVTTPHAQATLNTPTTISFGNVHVGASVSEAISISNSAVAPAETLDASVGSVTGSATATGSFAHLAAGGTDATDIVVGIDTTTVGAKGGSVSVALSSDGTGIDNNGVTALAGQTLQVSGTVYREAAASITTLPANLIVHVGDAGTEAITIKNTDANDGYSENLIANVAGTSGNITANGSTSAIAAQASSSALNVAFSTAAAGIVSGTVTLALTSDGTGIDGLGTTGLGQQAVSVNATVNNYARAAIKELSGGGTVVQNGNNTTLTLNLGPASTQAPDTASFKLAVLNDVIGPADLLSGSFTAAASSGFTLAGLSAFAGLAAGQSDTAPTISFKATSAGAYTETITLHSTGSNASGYLGALADETFTIVVNVGQSYSLTNHVDNIHGGPGNDMIIATNNALTAGDKIGGGFGDNNILALQGGGVFDLRAPATLANIQTVTAQEGAANNHPTVHLRDGMHDVVNVASAAAGVKNPGITIYGADDSDTTNLGSGNDDVFLGSSAETVNGGSGNSTFRVTASTIGAAIHGGTGSNVLDITGGGIVTMGSNITGIKTVNLENACSNYTFTTSAISGLTVIDSSHGDRINVTASNDTIIASHADIYLSAGTTNTKIIGNDDIIHIQKGDTWIVAGSHDTVVNDTVPKSSAGPLGSWMDNQSFNFSEQALPNFSVTSLVPGFVQAIGDGFVFGGTTASPSPPIDPAAGFVFGSSLDGHPAGIPALTHDFVAALTEITGTGGPLDPAHTIQTLPADAHSSFHLL